MVHFVDFQGVNRGLDGQEGPVRTVSEGARQRELSEEPLVLDLPSNCQNALFLLVVRHAVIHSNRKGLAVPLP